MNTYFIHTFELYYLLTFNEYGTLNRNLHRFYADGTYKCLTYTKEGITISFRKCTENEMKKKGYYFPYKLIIVVNPSRLIQPGTYINQIFNTDDFIRFINILNEKINEIFHKFIPDISGIEDFTLSRVDITKDIFNVPENIIQEYIRIIRKLTLHCGYHINNRLEENCLSYKQEDSINIVNDSNKTEFVLYNKHQATIDQNYPAYIQKYYTAVLRMELRCGRTFIQKKTKEMDVSEALEYFYCNMHSVVSDIFNRIFIFGNNVCFLSFNWQKKLIRRTTDTKKKKCEKMLNLASCLYRNPDKDFDDVLFKLFSSNKSRCNIISYFSDISLSPIATASKDIPFMQSLNSLLEFKKLSKDENLYFRLLSRKLKGVVLFLHNPDK